MNIRSLILLKKTADSDYVIKLLKHFACLDGVVYKHVVVSSLVVILKPMQNKIYLKVPPACAVFPMGNPLSGSWRLFFFYLWRTSEKPRRDFYTIPENAMLFG